ncbi:ribosomal-protein-alanine N-acetyltransferase [Kaistella chaponensis]|uniref:Ribosomal-protein-alanine N-acetyltransferase n=1 Tax=Kaistella chaponensis TaxID=713588 RepID=A0A1N7J8Q5_9FLAO|nr:GNAT family N-acetyltransferase [Kaistella chaponensis]SIS45738.1 ribosomal-protein-alanine N-acetyltransferase [Kaistella chaponensis]
MRFLTDRLILRTLTEFDSYEVLGIRSHPVINQFLHRDSPKNTFEALDFILNIQRKSANGEIFFLGIALQNKPELIGTICLWNFSGDRKTAELGYELLPEYHRKGIMSEAVTFILNFGFEDLNVSKIEAFTNKNNLNSIQLLQKFNFALNVNRKDEKYPENLIFELARS